MILIADSGSTKTDWVLASKDKPIYFHTKGLNPYYFNSKEIKEELSLNLLDKLNSNEVEEVHFYGSGCGVQAKKEIVSNTLHEIFYNSKITVNTDILGAARSLLGKKRGIACILGTGANSCFYDGAIIKEIVPSTGFILGDEGSGSYLGKSLITHYLKKTLPENLSKAFDEEFNLQHSEILDKIYRQQSPNKFLASFSPFIEKFLNEEFINNLVKTGFREFIDYFIKRYSNFEDLPIGFTGSIAYSFKSQLEIVFRENGLKIDSILKSPIENLVKFHG